MTGRVRMFSYRLRIEYFDTDRCELKRYIRFIVNFIELNAIAFGRTIDIYIHTYK